ncbi:carboxypeptidase-like regulatory domain-containing protein [Flavobacterium gelidilacus]|uniref:carboxypeptidase-like regulatory domain-containing protein n=1 Tax=Flavobacterium gelidilacus TaxID=206041 RepID=UPI0004034380|nr:carboxypeptidase-like regulatory domain-containing protein [Flavobacterium gelidilacus]
MRYFVVFLCLLVTSFGFSQTKNDSVVLVEKVKGTVVSIETLLPMNNVHVINTTQVKGTVTNGSGQFEIEGVVNDTIIFTYLGFETVKTVITNDWIKNSTTKIKLTEKIYVLDEIKLSQYNLTGYLEVDTKIIPVNENYRANITGLLAAYEVGDRSPNALGRVVRSVLNPADFLYNTFSKKTKEMKKLKQMKANEDIRKLLATKYDRETLASLLEIDKDDIPLILEKCNYSQDFIKSANDLQILDAISGCYEEYKMLKRL